MQGSGTFSVEALIGAAVPRHGKLPLLAHGEYGKRLGSISMTLGIETVIRDSGEFVRPDLIKLEHIDRLISAPGQSRDSINAVEKTVSEVEALR